MTAFFLNGMRGVLSGEKVTVAGVEADSFEFRGYGRKTKKGTENNYGLGLFVSYGIIKKYNGTISVENIRDIGCQFVIKIPQSH